EFGDHFLFQSNNPTDKMMFWARIPMVFVLIILGFYIFKWAKELFGKKAALLSLFLFSFSPTFLAHGRLVTTDVGAAAGIFIATYYFLKALQEPISRNIWLAGIAFGIAQLCKFSVILLIPFFVVLSFVYWFLKLGNLKQIVKTFFLIIIIGFAVIWPLYQYHVLNYPAQKQQTDAQLYLKDYPGFIKNPIIWASNKPILRPYAQYFTGLFMVFHRAAFGHTTYFMGEVSNLGWKKYFPIVYSIKAPLTFHILSLITIIYILKSIICSKKKCSQKIQEWIKTHFNEFAMLTFIAIYWASSLISSLNIGVRHLLPTLPFVFVLIGGAITKLLKQPNLKLKTFILGVLIAYQALSVVSVFPHFLAYFNEIVGGPDNGHVFTVDSNLDWGQDLRRLEKWTEEYLPAGKQIYVDYFGGSDPEYYLKEKYMRWECTKQEQDFPKNNYLAISATFLQSGRGTPIPQLEHSAFCYNWLDKYQLVEKIGYSIFVYYID
ncbi:glycosyltransferase family 39 protein, partial [Candidatus Parcubacteria bacterium]|nr:glycosyltransferase family 39 protein [Candidatus Parcubacteria bacterium]